MRINGKLKKKMNERRKEGMEIRKEGTLMQEERRE